MNDLFKYSKNLSEIEQKPFIICHKCFFFPKNSDVVELVKWFSKQVPVYKLFLLTTCLRLKSSREKYCRQMNYYFVFWVDGVLRYLNKYCRIWLKIFFRCFHWVPVLIYSSLFLTQWSNYGRRI